MALFQKSVLNQYLKQLDKSKVEIAYQKFKAHFHNTTIQQQIRESKEEQYQEGFFRDLFVDVFGYILNPQPNFNLTTELKNETNSKKVDGAILQNGNAIAVIELKGTNTTDLNTVKDQAFGYKNHQNGCKYVIISNFEKLRFYIDNAIDFEEFNLFTLTESEFNVLYLCLHIDNIFSDLPATIKQASTVKEQDITKQLYKDYSEFKRKLFADIVQLNPQYDKLILFKKSQKLLDRILFILFAEDRGLLQANTIQTILDEFENLKKLDAYQPLYERFKKHFTYLNNGFKNEKYEVFGYNGGLFANDEILDNILISDNLLLNYTPTLAKYDYETDVDVNILGHIFEHSLNDIEEIQAELDGTAIDKTKTKRKKDGVFYTPKYITKYIVENTVGALCTEKRNEFDIIADNYTPDKRKAKKKELLQKLDTYQSWLLQITIVDPACGSGAFLNQALDFLIQEHKNIDELRAQLLGESMVLPDHEVAILENNIFGVDLNEESVEIARLSLWLRTARKGRKLNSLNNNIKCGNSLIDDATIAGEKAFNWQNEFVTIFEKGGFDVVIGNPPWGAKVDDNSLAFLIKKYPLVPSKLKDSYMYFMLLALDICKKNGYLSLIVPNTWLLINNTSEFRKYFLSLNLKQIIDYGDSVFSDAIVESSTIVLKNELAPTGNVIATKFRDGKELINHIIDKSMWIEDELYRIVLELKFESFNIIKKMELVSNPFEQSSEIIFGIKPYQVGYGIPIQTKEILDKRSYHSKIKHDSDWYPLLTGTDVSRYGIVFNGEYIKYGKWLMYQSNEQKIKSQKLLLRRTSHDLRVSYDEEFYYPQNSLFIITSHFDLKYLMSLLNSKLFDFIYKAKCPQVGKIFAEVKPSIIKSLPIPKASNINQQPFIEKADTMLQKNKELQNIKSNVIKLLQSQYSTININTKLNNWNELSFKDFSKELEKQKIKLTISEKAELMQYFEQEQTKANNIQQIITQTDKEIDTMVYKLYELTDEEIKIVENN